MRYSNFTTEDENKFLEITKNGLVTAFIYSGNVCSNGKVSMYDDNDRSVRTIAISDVVFVPALFFSDYLNVEIMMNQNGASLKANGHVLNINFELSDATLNEKRIRLSMTPTLKNGTLYIPVIEIAKLLGFSAGSYYEGRMVAVGANEAIRELNENPALSNAGAYVIFGNYDATKFTSADFKLARLKWRERLVGNSDINNLNNPNVKDKIDAINERCKTTWETMHKKGDPICLWGEDAPSASSDLTAHYGMISKMAKGYATVGSNYYKNENLLSDIIFGMEWMYRHMYGEAEIAGTGWRDVHIFNWWDWFVGGPEHMTDIMFMLEDEISLEDKRRYLKCFSWITTFMCANPTQAMSRISVCTKVALALEDVEMIQKEYLDFDYLLVLKENGEGPHVDYVDYTHGFPHNMSYGVLNLDRVLLVASILSGTPLEFSNPQQYNQFGMARYMFEPAMYCGQGFSMFTGRSLTRKGYEAGVSAIVNLLPMIGVFGDDEDRYIKRLIKRNSVYERIRNLVKSRCSFYDLATYEDIIADDSIPYTNDYEYAHAWYTGDRAAQHRNDYAIGIALSSKRQFTYESINDENKRGWYSGDGATYLYTKYDDNAYETTNFIQNTNIAYRYPGTTEDVRERVVRSIMGSKAWKPSKSFAGAIQVCDKYLVAGMDFESFNFEGPDENLPEIGYGAGLAVHVNDLRSKRSWFCFDDEIVMLSAGISSSMNSDVNSIVDHRRIVKDEEFAQYVGNEKGITEFSKTAFEYSGDDTKWINMQGHAGFVFLEKGNVYARRYVSEECGNQSYFEIGIAHGKNPCEDTYAYAILPYATNERLEEYYKSPDVLILSNTPELQVVKENGLGILGCVFHSPARFESIEVDSPMILVSRELDDGIELSVTDPTHELEVANIVVCGSYAVADSNSRTCIEQTNGACNIKVNLSGANGRPIRIILNNKG